MAKKKIKLYPEYNIVLKDKFAAHYKVWKEKSFEDVFPNDRIPEKLVVNNLCRESKQVEFKSVGDKIEKDYYYISRERMLELYEKGIIEESEDSELL